MKAATRRVYDMCGRVLSWASAHPDDEAGTSVLVAQLKALAARIAQVITEQRNGLVDSRAASLRKRELGKTFRFKPTADTYVAFQSAGRGMYGEAQSHKEVLVQHGLSESVLAEFGTMLDEFDAAVTLGAEGRMVHTAATRELEALTKEVGRIVRAMDARNRVRFRNDRPALEQWISARTVLGTPWGSSGDEETPVPAPMPVVDGGTPGAAGDVRPAA